MPQPAPGEFVLHLADGASNNAIALAENLMTAAVLAVAAFRMEDVGGLHAALTNLAKAVDACERADRADNE